MSANLQPGGDEVEALLSRYAETRERALRDRVVEGQLHLARSVASHFAGRGVEYDDLFQVAALALTRAVERYDPAHGARFSTFATTCMAGEVKNYFRDRSRLIRAPRRMYEKLRLVNAAVEQLTHQLQRSPRPEEIAERCALSEDEVLEALEFGDTRQVSLDEAPDEGEYSVADTLGGADAGFLRVENADRLRRAMTALTPMQREVLHLRYFGNLTQREIAERTGASQMAVSRAERGALAILRRELKSMEE